MIAVSFKGDSNNLITLLGSKQKYKPVNSWEFVTQGSFCSRYLFLNNDSTFLDESGCEGRAQITIGTWKYEGDSIELIATENSKLTWVANVEISAKNNNTHVVFKFLDKRGAPVPYFVILPISNKEKVHLTSNPEIVLDSNYKRIYCPKTNLEGIVSVEKAKFDTLVFPQLERISKKPFRFPSKGLPDSMKIYLDIVDYGMGSPDVTYDNWDKPKRLKMGKGKLGNLDQVNK